MIFYRAYEVIPTRLLQMRRAGAGFVIEWPAAFLGCALEESVTLGASAVWLPSPIVMQQFDDKLRAVVPLSATSKFYRLRCNP